MSQFKTPTPYGGASIFDKYDLVDVDESFPIPELPENGLTLLVGASGTGKSTILNAPKVLHDENKPLTKLFSSEERAEELLIACGLRSIPTWRRTLSTISNGERARAEIALSIDRGIDKIDEFTSVVDRDTAKSLSVSLSKYAKNMKRLIVASCHRDVIEWLCPDHIYDTDKREWLARGSLRRPKIVLNTKALPIGETWPIFKKHHYLSASVNRGAFCIGAFWGDKLVAMASCLAYPSGTVKNAWREHRTVVLPEFQGLGIGNAVSNLLADWMVNNGYRYFSKTSHPSMGEHREKSHKWKPTSKNKMARKDYNTTRKTKEDGHKMKHKHRVCYSHEFLLGEQ